LVWTVETESSYPGRLSQILSFKGKNVEVRAIPDLAKNERDMGHGSIGRDSV
jgi:hypothetical protein